jgi:hypothetical protein
MVYVYGIAIVYKEHETESSPREKGAIKRK